MMSGRTKPKVMPPLTGVMSAFATPAWSGAAWADGASATTIRPATRPARLQIIAVLQRQAASSRRTSSWIRSSSRPKAFSVASVMASPNTASSDLRRQRAQPLERVANLRPALLRPASGDERLPDLVQEELHVLVGDALRVLARCGDDVEPGLGVDPEAGELEPRAAEPRAALLVAVVAELAQQPELECALQDLRSRRGRPTSATARRDRPRATPPARTARGPPA